MNAKTWMNAEKLYCVKKALHKPQTYHILVSHHKYNKIITSDNTLFKVCILCYIISTIKAGKVSHSSNTFYHLAEWLLHGRISNNYWMNEWMSFTLKILPWLPIAFISLNSLLQIISPIWFSPFFFVAYSHFIT